MGTFGLLAPTLGGEKFPRCKKRVRCWAVKKNDTHSFKLNDDGCEEEWC